MENLANKICQPTKAELLSQLEPILTYIQQEAPLIHCITNPISINDCANILLAIGARPIMAEHPDEVAEITAIAKGLALNLGNITDARMASMKISAGAAKDKGIPFVLDLVGLSCSRLRQKYAKELLVELAFISNQDDVILLAENQDLLASAPSSFRRTSSCCT